MVIVNHDKVLSNLYVSTRFTPHDVLFSLSLERVMFYNPNVTWTESWLPSTAGDKPFADVYKIQGKIRKTEPEKTSLLNNFTKHE